MSGSSTVASREARSTSSVRTASRPITIVIAAGSTSTGGAASTAPGMKANAAITMAAIVIAPPKAATRGGNTGAASRVGTSRMYSV